MQRTSLLPLTMIVLFLQLALSHHFRVVAPQMLVQVFMNKYNTTNIPFSIANYGDVPYGKTISGQVALPSVLQDCEFEQLPQTERNKPILLVERNDCTFTQKSINVQKQGGKLAVIMDSHKNQSPDNIVMIDDGRGSQVHIPTVLISYQDGVSILKAIRDSSVVLSVQFQLQKKQKSDLTIWLDISDHSNFIFLRNLKPYYSKIKQYVNLNIAYPTRLCPSCLQSDCFYNGSYCRSDYIYSGIQNKGQLLIGQQLRQYFISKESIMKWWMYVLLYDDKCDSLAVVEQCSNQIMRGIGVGVGKINQMVKNSFGTEDNQVLRQFSQQKYNNSISYYPSVIINNIIYRGNLQPFEVYQVICQSIYPEPQGCFGYVAPEQSSLPTWIIFVIVLSILFGVFLVVCYRRMARRELSQKINSQVNQLVNQYITMYQHDRYNQMEQSTKREGAE